MVCGYPLSADLGRATFRLLPANKLAIHPPLLRRCAISADTTTYTDSWTNENPAIRAARRRGDELNVASPSPTTGAMLAVLASALRAKAVVEVGTGVGISGLRLLDGMEADGILTTIDPDASHQSAAKETFGNAGLEPGRARQITGQPSQVLPRLADGAYDLVLINDFEQDPKSFLSQARRLLRDGGM
ncbi:MAG: class I SAM-dependent methyltransferase, partial [Actinomycetes bacterium]